MRTELGAVPKDKKEDTNKKIEIEDTNEDRKGMTVFADGYWSAPRTNSTVSVSDIWLLSSTCHRPRDLHPGSPDSAPAFTGESLRNMLASTAKLREVALLTELLQPPIALRHTRRLR